jgi:carboxyl-terminal processing protease
VANLDFKDNNNNDSFHGDYMGRRSRINKTVVVAVIIGILFFTNLLSLYAGSILALPIGRGKVSVSRSDYNRLQDVKVLMEDKNVELSEVFSRYEGVLKFEKMFRIRETLKHYYLEEFSDDVILEGAIRGMTSALDDPYTVFMNKKEFEDFNNQTEGAYVGVGLHVGVRDDRITVVSPINNSPAKKAGILPGDVIIRVNGRDVGGRDLELAVSMMRGKENEEVTVTIAREGRDPFDVIMKRARIVLETVSGEVLGDGIGYIQITMFDKDTGKDFTSQLESLKKQGMKALILDLRGNPGGLLSTCIEVASQFVEQGKVIVSTKDKQGREVAQKSRGGIATGIPLVILTDEGTASASEIVSGAVRDYDLGTLIGKNTFGKGLVQSMFDLRDGTALKITISRYYTPNGTNINKVGIKPDIEIDFPVELRGQYTREVDPQFQKALEVIRGKIN